MNRQVTGILIAMAGTAMAIASGGLIYSIVKSILEGASSGNLPAILTGGIFLFFAGGIALFVFIMSAYITIAVVWGMLTDN
jgi:hypothetical protein